MNTFLPKANKSWLTQTTFVNHFRWGPIKSSGLQMCNVLSKEMCTLLVLRCEVCGLGGWGFLKEEEKHMDKKTGDLVNIYRKRLSSTSREFNPPGFLLVSIGFWKAWHRFVRKLTGSLHHTCNVNMDPQSSDSMRKHTRHKRLVP